MATSKWVFRLSDGQYLRGGFCEPTLDPAVEGVEAFSDANPHPDPRLERAPGRRPASAAEVQAYDDERADQTAQTDQATKAIKATVIWTLKRVLGRNPTPTEIQAARDEWIAIWKALS